MKKVTKKMVVLVGVVLVLIGNCLIFNFVKSSGADMFQAWGNIEALAHNENSWEGKNLKIVKCTCPNGSPSGYTLRCRSNGDLESCTITQQGSNACYEKDFTKMLCEGTGIKFDGE